MPGRKCQSGTTSYRYSINGQEKDKELNENITTALYWEYDGRIGRRWNTDPVVKEYEGPYIAFANNPIWNIDYDGADTTPVHNNVIEDVSKSLGYKKDKPIELLQRIVNHNLEGVQSTKNKISLNFDQFVAGEIDSKDFNSLNKKYQSELEMYEKGAAEGISLMYKWSVADQKYIEAFNQAVTIRNVLYAQVALDIATLGVGTPLASSAGLSISSKSLFSLRGGYGVFGQKGLQIGGYKIEAMYANRVYGTGTIISIKQIGKQGGNLLRWDYGVIHGSQKIGLHSTFRFNIRGVTYGSNKQLPWHAPFKFWQYSK